MKRILILNACLLSTLSARFTAEEILGEDSAYQVVTRRATDIVQPIIVQIREEKERIGAPVNAAMEPLKCEREAINHRMQELYEEQTLIREQSAKTLKRLEEEKGLRLKAVLAPMEEALSQLRTPILERVVALRAERDAIERAHYENKSKYPGLMDGTDSMDTALKMGFKTKAIEELYASVDGDLPIQIAAKKRAITEEFIARLEDENMRCTSAINAIKARLAELSVVECSLSQRIGALENQRSLAITAAMPEKDALIRRIEDQVVNALISGIAIP